MKPVDKAREILLESCKFSMEYYKGYACQLILDCQSSEQCTSYDEEHCLLAKKGIPCRNKESWDVK